MMLLIQRLKYRIFYSDLDMCIITIAMLCHHVFPRTHIDLNAL